MIPEFENLIDIAKAELEAEDLYLRSVVASNPSTYPPKQVSNKCGLLRFANERFYQYILTRGLLRSCLFPVALEKNTYDLVLFNKAPASGWFAVVEMKRWMSVSGKGKELQGIKDDFDKLLKAKSVAEGKPSHGLMIIFSVNKTEAEVEQNSRDLASEVNYNTVPYVRTIPTYNNQGTPVYFWIAGYEVF